MGWQLLGRGGCERNRKKDKRFGSEIVVEKSLKEMEKPGIRGIFIDLGSGFLRLCCGARSLLVEGGLSCARALPSLACFRRVSWAPCPNAIVHISICGTFDPSFLIDKKTQGEKTQIRLAQFGSSRPEAPSHRAVGSRAVCFYCQI